MRWLALPILIMTVAGCSPAMQYARSEYQGVDVQEIAVPGDDTYRVFDKPSAGKMMITSSIGFSARQTIAQGTTFGTVGGFNPKPRFEAAAVAWLKGTGRETCRITDGYLLQQPQWEFKYDCGPGRL